MSLFTYHFAFSTTGGAGASASPAIDGSIPFDGNVSVKPISGKVKSVYVKYNTQAVTTDLVIKTLGKNAPSQTFLTLTNANTDGVFYPRVPVVDSTGAAALYAAGGAAVLTEPVVDDYVCVTVAQGNDKAMDVWLTVEC